MDDLTPGWGWETFRIFAWNRHGCVDACRQFGTIRDGGPFETVMIRVIVIDGDRIRRNEVFAIDDVDRALARFEELCAGAQ